MKFYLSHGFPAVTTKKLAWKWSFVEMLWFLRGDTNTSFLKKHGVDIWDEWADKDGNVGRVYGAQWRQWRAFDEYGYDTETKLTTGKVKYIDQIAMLMHGLKNDPFSRRHIITAWRPDELNYMSLPPCHIMVQFIVEKLDPLVKKFMYKRWHKDIYGKLMSDTRFPMVPERLQNQITHDKVLHMIMYIRSNDLFLGCPFNMSQYAMLQHIVAQQLRMYPGTFTYSIGSAHIYSNHINQVNQQCIRNPFPLPKLVIKRKPVSIFDYNIEDFDLHNYQHHPALKGEVAV